MSDKAPSIRAYFLKLFLALAAVTLCGMFFLRFTPFLNEVRYVAWVTEKQGGEAVDVKFRRSCVHLVYEWHPWVGWREGTVVQVLFGDLLPRTEEEALSMEKQDGAAATFDDAWGESVLATDCGWFFPVHEISWDASLGEPDLVFSEFVNDASVPLWSLEAFQDWLDERQAN